MLNTCRSVFGREHISFVAVEMSTALLKDVYFSSVLFTAYWRAMIMQ